MVMCTSANYIHNITDVSEVCIHVHPRVNRLVQAKSEDFGMLHSFAGEMFFYFWCNCFSDLEIDVAFINCNSSTFAFM